MYDSNRTDSRIIYANSKRTCDDHLHERDNEIGRNELNCVFGCLCGCL